MISTKSIFNGEDIMSLLDDFSVNAKACADKVSRKADAAVELSRLKINENRLQREISKSLKLLGAKVYKAYSINDANLNVNEDVTAIHDMYDRLKSIRRQIVGLKSSEFTQNTSMNTEAEE